MHSEANIIGPVITTHLCSSMVGYLYIQCVLATRAISRFCHKNK